MELYIKVFLLPALLVAGFSFNFIHFHGDNIKKSIKEAATVGSLFGVFFTFLVFAIKPYLFTVSPGDCLEEVKSYSSGSRVGKHIETTRGTFQRHIVILESGEKAKFYPRDSIEIDCPVGLKEDI